MNESMKDSEAGASLVLGPEPARLVVRLSGVNVHVTGHAPSVIITHVAVSKEQAFGPDSPEWSSNRVKRFTDVHAQVIEQVRNGKWEHVRTSQGVRARRRTPAGAALHSATDWFPSPKTRKLLKKLVVDQQSHIEQLAAEGRIVAARWQWYWTWALLLWYGGMHAISGLSRAFRGKVAS